MERLEASENGRVLISAFVIVILVCSIVTTLPLFGLERTLHRPATPLLRLTALEQDWGVFAPNPRNMQLRLRVILRYSDGTRWTWTAPRNDPFVGSVRDYRWRKWEERLVFKPTRSALASTARHAASSAPRPGAVEATVVRQARAIPAPGKTAAGPWLTKTSTVELGA